ncbi:MAG: hypothetical protein D6828_00725 [Nitrospirae bacterium]|nr:MAG: hypothetical protein D6828_00725 [Nitrospirota bacterium]
MTAKDENGKILLQKKKEYIHIGIDVDNYQRYGAWQIKEIIDLAIQPREVTKERFELAFPKETDKATLITRLYYYLNSSKHTLVAEDKKELSWEE